MTRLFYIHYHADEAEGHAQVLRQAGYAVECHATTHQAPALSKENLPDILVLSLDRLPSHVRAVADWYWEAKYRRVRPIVFVGGLEEKVETARRQFPNAVFCRRDDLLTTLAAVSAAMPQGEPA